jgi:hypothetical protein
VYLRSSQSQCKIAHLMSIAFKEFPSAVATLAGALQALSTCEVSISVSPPVDPAEREK